MVVTDDYGNTIPFDKRAYARAYYLKHRKLKGKRDLDLNRKLQRKEERLAYGKAWRLANKKPPKPKPPKLTAEERKARRRETGAAWCRRNKHKVAAKRMRHVAARRRATPIIPVHLPFIDEFYMLARAIGMHVDHLVPIHGENVCGLHNIHNLQLLTREENRAKSNHFPYPAAPPGRRLTRVLIMSLGRGTTR